MIETMLKEFDLVVVGAVMWLLALGLGYGAVDRLTAAGDLQAVVSAARELQPQPLQLTREPLPAADYKRIAETVQPYLTGGLKVEPTTTHLAVTGERLELQPALLAALQEVALAAPDTQWSIETMCIGPECRPLVAAKVKGYAVRTRTKGK